MMSKHVCVCGVRCLWFCRVGELASESLWSLVLFLLSLCRPRQCIIFSFGSHILYPICKTAFEQSRITFLMIFEKKICRGKTHTNQTFIVFKKGLSDINRKEESKGDLTYPFSYVLGGCRNKGLLNFCNVGLLFKPYDDIVKNSK